MSAHIHTAKHFCVFAAIRTEDLDGSRGQRSNPCINDRTAKNGEDAKEHEYEHDNLVFSEENPDVHNDDACKY